MKLEENKKIVLDFWKAFSAGKVDDCLAMMSDTAVWVVPGKPEHFPISGPRTKAELTEILNAFFSVLPEGIKVTPDLAAITAEGDRVALEAESYAKTVAGKIYNNLYHFLFIVRDGKIQKVKEHLDTLHLKEVILSCWEQ